MEAQEKRTAGKWRGQEGFVGKQLVKGGENEFAGILREHVVEGVM